MNHLTKLLGGIAAGTAVVVGTIAAPGHAARDEPVSQRAALNWHPQSGNEGAVGDGAEATLERTADGISYEITTHSLNPGHTYSVWFVVINDPGECSDSPCAAPEFLAEPAIDAQVTWGLDGQVADDDGNAVFAAEIAAGPLPDGWLPVQGLDDPLGAEIHFALNDHGPAIDELTEEMVSTYRAGCSDDSPFPEIFPDAAIADGTPGPNTCQLYQSVAFLTSGLGSAVQTTALDVETLEVEVPEGALAVEARPNAFVGEVTEDLFIGISLPDGTGAGAEVSVYLCDGELGEWMSGQLAADGTVSLAGEDATVELEVSHETVTGSVGWQDQPAEPFTATPATGDAGVYAADATFDDVAYSAGWVVLPDGRQRGSTVICRGVPPFMACWVVPK